MTNSKMKLVKSIMWSEVTQLSSEVLWLIRHPIKLIRPGLHIHHHHHADSLYQHNHCLVSLKCCRS